jgi:prophage antirepressor-like protein
MIIRSMDVQEGKLLKGMEYRHLTTSPRGITIIPKSDVYRLVLRSNKPQALAFQDWIVEEVIPAVEKTGKYSMAGVYHLIEQSRTGTEFLLQGFFRNEDHSLAPLQFDAQVHEQVYAIRRGRVSP